LAVDIYAAAKGKPWLQILAVLVDVNDSRSRVSRQTKQLRQINSSHPEPLQYIQHIQRRQIMGTFKEVVCGSLIIITFAAILYSVPL
jgi:hypothetical protein